MNGIEFIAYEEIDKSGKIWYHALCMDVVLESGIAIIPVQKCEQFYQEEKHALINIRDAEAEKRYFTCMWLWYDRLFSHDKNKICLLLELPIKNKYATEQMIKDMNLMVSYFIE